MNKFFNYLKEVKGELSHVTWLTKKQVVLFTIIVIIISVITAFYLGFLDYIFSELVKQFIL
ncbi:preprotein translocase subunit SecE [Patescibacteria group bacterium]